MSTRIIFVSLCAAALLSTYSSAIAAIVRPEVAGPLDQARVLANGGSKKARIEAKLNQADGMHPTAEGVDIVVKNILPTVEAFLGALSGERR